jgi:hypothetical protein
MEDETEFPRRIIQAQIHSEIESDNPMRERARLQVKYGIDNVWDTDEVSRVFEITGFFAPFCGATRKSDNVKGSLEFQHHPRFYFNFEPK